MAVHPPAPGPSPSVVIPRPGRAGAPIGRSGSHRAALVGSVVAVALVAVPAAAMVPLRDHLAVATAALVLVVPVVAGVAVGGFAAGIVATVTGFVAYDFLFIPPYSTLSVGAAQNWAALGVYAVVMLVVSRVVARLDAARAEAQYRAEGVRRLFDLSELLVRDLEVGDLLEAIVEAMVPAFSLDGAALLLPAETGLELVASAGRSLDTDELDRLSAHSAVPVTVGRTAARQGDVQVVALEASDRAIGLLALRGPAETGSDRELLGAFANHLALALERSQLREQAVRARLLEEVDRLRRSLVGAVSHDLRTPLATIKVATSTLLDTGAPVGPVDAGELVGLIDAQADRLERLVSNLLDMTRIQSGTLELRRRSVSVADVVGEAIALAVTSPEPAPVSVLVPRDLPDVDVDPVLVRQALANLIDNALRHAPERAPVNVSATSRPGGHVEVAVEDRGPGVAADERTTIFEMFNRREAGGRGGLGLAIAKAFVEAHGEHIWVEDVPGGGARFCFGLPAAGLSSAGLPAARLPAEPVTLPAEPVTLPAARNAAP
jgi:two-component system sensor histidine kinase KdpD